MPWIDANGVSLRYEASGRGEIAVLFHELGGSLASWNAIAPELRERFRVVRYDQRGAGLSEKVRRPFGFDDLVDDFEALAHGLGLEPPFHLLGVAAGAPQAVMVALRHPEWARSLILGNPALTMDPKRIEHLELRADRAEREGMRAILPLTLERSFPPAACEDQAAYADYKARHLAYDPVCFALMNRAFARIDLHDVLGRIRCPTLIVCGRDDQLRPPAESIALEGRLLRARYEVVEGGHFLHVQRPRGFLAAAERFLAANCR